MKNKLLLLWLGLSSAAQAQMSLPDAVALALKQNLNIEMARLDQDVAEKNARWMNAGYLPNISANGAYTWSETDVTQELNVADGQPGQTREFPDAVSENYQAGISGSYLLFNGLGRLNDFQRLQLQAELSDAQLRFTVENVVLSVFNAYFNVARLEEFTAISKESLKLSRDRYERAKTAFELGSGSSLEMLNALVDLRQDSISYLDQRQAFQRSRRELNRVLLLPVDTTYQVDTVVRFRSDLDYLALRKEALNNNVALIQARINKEIQQKNLNIAWSGRMPTISANGGYNFSRQDNEGGFLRFVESSGWQYGLSAQWNIFSSYRSQTQVETARIAIYRSELSLQQAREDLKVDLANAWLAHQHLSKMRPMRLRNRQTAFLNFQRSQEAYSLGQISSLQLREAQLNYVNAKAAFKDLLYQLKVAEVDLLRVAGLMMRAEEG